MTRTREFSEPDLVNLSQGLVSVCTATTKDQNKLQELVVANQEVISMYQVFPEINSRPKVFNVFWNNQLAGQIILQIKNSKHAASISYWVDSKLSNRQIATTAVLLIREHAFDALRLEYIEAYVDPENTKSIRVLEKSKFVKTEALYETKNLEGKPILHLVYKTYK